MGEDQTFDGRGIVRIKPSSSGIRNLKISDAFWNSGDSSYNEFRGSHELEKIFIVFFRNSLIAVAASGAAMGLFGFILAGKEGLINGAIWGLVLGTIAIPYFAFMAVAKAYEGFAHGIGGAIMKHQIEGDKTPPEPDEKYFK